MKSWSVLLAFAPWCACVSMPDGNGGSDTDTWFGDDPTDLDAEDDGHGDPTGDAAGTGHLAALCRSPGVFFCDGFEDGLNESWDADSGDLRLIEGSAVAGEGDTVLELVTYEDVNTSKLLYRFEDEPQVYARFDVQYADDFDAMGSSVLGPRLAGSPEWWGSFGRSGEKPTGEDFFAIYIAPTGVIGTDAEFGLLGYFANMRADTTGTYFGNYLEPDQEPPILIEPGTWYCVEFGVVLNTPGQSDGSTTIAVNGRTIGTFTQMQLRTVNTFGANVFVLDSYDEFAGQSRSESRPNRVRYDNVILSTEPIGCVGGHRH